MKTTRRLFLTKASLSTAAVMAAGSMFSKSAKGTPTATAAASENPDIPSANADELEDFVYDIENGSAGFKGAGGSAKEATVEEFPISKSIAGVSMHLEPGGFREMHWHSIAAEWAYILEGEVRTTVITPDGTTSTDDFEKGDIWYFPKGHGHMLQCLGDKPCHFLLGLTAAIFLSLEPSALRTG